MNQEFASQSLYWLKNRPYDLLFFSLSGLAFLLLILPYKLWGAAVVFPIYNIYLIFFGLPHNYLTWASIAPASSRRSMKLESVYKAALVCGVICLLIPFTRGTDLNDWILSFISYYSLWHAYRQHAGICKVYDSVQAKRTGDYSIFADRKYLNLFFGLAANAIVVWAFTHPRIDYLLSSTESYRLIYPQIPMNLFYIYCAVTAAIGIYGMKKAVWDRFRQDKFIPYPQLLLMGIALLTYTVPYLFMPISAMPLAVAIATMFHNWQYFGFVWLYEGHRSKALSEEKLPMQLPHRLALKSSWMQYFGIAFAYSFIVIAFYLVTPGQVGLTFIYFLGLSHYIIDGYIWRRDHNQFLPAFISRMSGTSAQTEKFMTTPASLAAEPQPAVLN